MLSPVTVRVPAQMPAPTTPAATSRHTPATYMNPYLAGVGIGLALILAFIITGRGLGASGGFSAVAASSVRAAAPSHGADNQFYADFAGSMLGEWLFIELIGVMIGGFASAWLARRFSFRVDAGPRITHSARLGLAFGGGAIMGIGAKLARGCTSGLGLTGGSLLSVGSWLFVIAAFASAYLFAPVVKRAWR